MGSFEITQISDKIFINKNNETFYKKINITDTSQLIKKLTDQVNKLKFESMFNFSSSTAVPLPLKNIAINGEKIIKLLKETELSDELEK